MHHNKVSTNYPWLPHNMNPSLSAPRQYKNMPINPLGDRQKIYDDFLKSCENAFGTKKGQRCRSTEEDRIEMTLRQPQSMQNYTEMGFAKIQAPKALFSLIQEFWEKNKDKGKVEQWGSANTYTNNWEFPSEMVSVEDSLLRGGGTVLKQKIWDSARDVSRRIAKQCAVAAFFDGTSIVSRFECFPCSRLSASGLDKS